MNLDDVSCGLRKSRGSRLEMEGVRRLCDTEGIFIQEENQGLWAGARLQRAP